MPNASSSSLHVATSSPGFMLCRLAVCFACMHAATAAHRAALPSSRSSLAARLLRAPSSNPTIPFRMAACRLNASADTPEGLSDGCRGAPLVPGAKLPLPGDESLMKAKAHGTTETGVKPQLRWGCDVRLADRICCYNRHYAEHAGYWESTNFLKEVDRTKETVFYDSVTGRPLFVAPRGRSFAEWEKESRSHGWPSFRDEEVIWDDVRVLPDGEAVSTAGTHLGHNLPDRKGNRYCINLVSVAAHQA